MQHDLAGALRRAAPEALDPHPVRFAYLFGSHAAGTARPDSDVDIALLLTEDVPRDEADRIAFRCADTLSAATQVPGVEVAVLNGAPLRFVGRVLRERVVLYSRDESARVAYESLLGRMADDVEIWAAEMDRELLTAIVQRRR